MQCPPTLYAAWNNVLQMEISDMQKRYQMEDQIDKIFLWVITFVTIVLFV